MSKVRRQGLIGLYEFSLPPDNIFDICISNAQYYSLSALRNL